MLHLPADTAAGALPFVGYRALAVAPILSADRTETGVAGNADAGASVAGDRMHPVGVDNYDAAGAVAAASGWVVDATATTNSALAWVLRVALVVAAVVAPVGVEDLHQYSHSAVYVAPAGVHLVVLHSVVVAAVGVVVVPGRTCVLQPLASRPCSVDLDSVRTGHGGPSSCWDRDNHGTVIAWDGLDTHSDRPWAYLRPAGPCVVVVVAVDHRAFPVAVDGAAALEVLLRVWASHSHRYGPASLKDADVAVVGR